MSFGNTKSNGNKGNNYPFQHALLKLIGTIGIRFVVNRTTDLIEDAASAGAQPLPITAVSYSILFVGIGGTLNGISVPDKYQVNYGNGFDIITGPLSYTRPPLGRVLISTLT